jgi:hypothetical protein
MESEGFTDFAGFLGGFHGWDCFKLQRPEGAMFKNAWSLWGVFVGWGMKNFEPWVGGLTWFFARGI